MRIDNPYSKTYRYPKSGSQDNPMYRAFNEGTTTCDRWWIEKIEKSGWIKTWRDNQVCNYICLECDEVSKENCDYYEWQSLKQSILEVKQ